ncbi:IclR family transcriptional regulator [Mesorhizobium sp. BR1-1-6]|uniref:IclR family transcriptional regulator n=1 Tax=Mesorhizobium sp. BR1-1-6 TaxID=2876648 RepID=UPI001CD0F7AE|nr:IclR family transcriptional regulator [Mesorhizobium sp. BR1-1-6]MBZ9893292.1 IclR family transcriptional regulator [Mesorhizobium sp. BR1-1-6]
MNTKSKKPGAKDSPLERYISIMETVAPFEHGLTAIELETTLGLPKTTINRLLHALIESGMITAESVRNRTYRLGDRLLQLLQMSPDSGWLTTLAQRPLQDLADRTGQSAFLSKFDGIEVRSVTCVAPDTPVRTYVMPGMAMPVNATASAKAILAFHPQETVKRILATELRSYTDRTKTKIAELTRELAEVREQGYAMDLAEHVPGLGSIAFPIRPTSGEVIYAVGLTGPYGQIIEQNFKQHCAALAEAAQRMAKLAQMHAYNGSAMAAKNAAADQRQGGA